MSLVWAQEMVARATRASTHLRKSSIWTTAGAIFSTTSAMKLNLYRGLVSWWRPTLTGRTRCISAAQTTRIRVVDAGLPHLTSPGRPRGSERSGHLSWATHYSHKARAGPLWASCQGPLLSLLDAVHRCEETVPHLTPACSPGLSLQALAPCSGWTRLWLFPLGGRFPAVGRPPPGPHRAAAV